MATGWDLYSTLAEAAAYEDYYRAAPPTACPNDGEPLLEGPPEDPAILFCRYDGWTYPDDWDPTIHSGM